MQASVVSSMEMLSLVSSSGRYEGLRLERGAVGWSSDGEKER